MDSSWSKVRQVVADRVLSRHLKDLHDQQTAPDRERVQSVHHVPPDVHAAQRNRAGSIQIVSAREAEERPQTRRRHSMPVTDTRGCGTTRGSTSTRVGTIDNRDSTTDICGNAKDTWDSSTGTRGSASTRSNIMDIRGSTSTRSNIMNTRGSITGRRTSRYPDIHEEARPPPSYELRPGPVSKMAEDPEENILDMMANTLQTAQRFEEERGSLYLQPATGRQDSQVNGGTRPHVSSSDNLVKRGPTSSKELAKPGLADVDKFSREKESLSSKDLDQRGKKAEKGVSDGEDGPTLKLDKGETFVKAESFEVLSFDQSVTKNAKPETGSKPSTFSSSKGKTLKDIINVPTPRPRNDVSVEFYDEDVGLKNDDGGFTPAESLSLPMHLLRGSSEGEDGEDPVSGCPHGSALSGENPWEQAQKCRYIRGHDPADMRVPDDAVEFVFSDDRQEEAH